jgi:hypothetical protein
MRSDHGGLSTERSRNAPRARGPSSKVERMSIRHRRRSRMRLMCSTMVSWVWAVFTTHMNTTQRNSSPKLTLDVVARLLAKRSFCTLATTSPNARPHVAGVVYAYVEGALYISTTQSSRKARNLVANPHVFICVPVRRLPFGPPPSTVQFASTVSVLLPDDREISALASNGKISSIVSHGERTMPDGCFLKVEPPATYFTYGLGMSLRQFGGDPLHASGQVENRTRRLAVSGHGQTQ